MSSRLVLAPVFALALALPASSNALASDHESPGPAEVSTYQVQPGDTLAAIAREFDTTVTAIAQANDIADPNRIAAGAMLEIPGADDPAEPVPPEEAGLYEVQPGDTLAALAARFDTTVTQIVISNNIADRDVIEVGDELVIPGAHEPPLLD